MGEHQAALCAARGHSWAHVALMPAVGLLATSWRSGPQRCSWLHAPSAAVDVADHAWLA
ncbi:hypothetical protein Dimus_010340, partial [Dionaea muscipula]